jgi:hypothetical protein
VPAPVRVIEEGPIRYRSIARYGDPDLEHGLRHAGYEPPATDFRVIEAEIGQIDTVAYFATMRHKPESLIEVVRSGIQLPPIVVVNAPLRFVLIDGVHRTYAAWALGLPTIEAYELMP